MNKRHISNAREEIWSNQCIQALSNSDLEADFNTLNKIIFNLRLISRMKQAHVPPKKIINGRQLQSAIQLAVNKKLISDITN